MSVFLLFFMLFEMVVMMAVVTMGCREKVILQALGPLVYDGRTKGKGDEQDVSLPSLMPAVTVSSSAHCCSSVFSFGSGPTIFQQEVLTSLVLFL